MPSSNTGSIAVAMSSGAISVIQLTRDPPSASSTDIRAWW
jgi:hypothetical protein